MPRLRPQVILPILAALLLAARAEAGPCLTCSPPTGPEPIGWWNDRAVSLPAEDARHPRIDVGQTDAGSLIAIVWEDRAGGGGIIRLALSEDGGCSWVERPLTAPLADSELPDVAVVASLDVVAVAFASGGVPFATVSLDRGRTFSPVERVHPSAAVDRASPPRIAAVPVNGVAHVHVVWGAGGSIWHVKSIGGAPGAWVSGPPLSDTFAGFSGWTAPDVAADTRSINPSAFSAVTIVASGVAPGRSVPEIFVVRSNDSAATFYGDPAVPATLHVPRRISDPRADDPSLAASMPSIDSNDDGSGSFFVWNVVTWTDPGAAGPVSRLDARSEEGSGPTIVADWSDPPTGHDVPPQGHPGPAGAVSVVPNPLKRPPTPDLHAFYEDASSGTREIAAVRGDVNQRADPSVEFWCPPYQLTGITPPRAAGEVVAGSVSADEDLSDVYVAWADTRDGGSRVYFKRTDSVVAPPTGITAAPAPCASGGGLSVSWTLPASPPNCDVDHVHVDYGFSPGSYTDGVDAPPASPFTLTGLFDGATYYVRVSVVDEACNVAAAAEVAGVASDCGGIPPCPNPVGIIRVRKTGADVELSWPAAPVDPTHGPATSYDVYRSLTRARDGFGSAPLANVPGLVALDAGAAVAPSATPRHFYLLVSRNSCGTSGDEPLP